MSLQQKSDTAMQQLSSKMIARWLQLTCDHRLSWLCCVPNYRHFNCHPAFLLSMLLWLTQPLVHACRTPAAIKKEHLDQPRHETWWDTEFLCATITVVYTVWTIRIALAWACYLNASAPSSYPVQSANTDSVSVERRHSWRHQAWHSV